MASRESASHAAVFFFGPTGISRHMLFSEFEALLDGCGLPEYQDEDAKAAYVLISATGNIQAIVFFKIYFDEDGRADSSWNVPVEKLADVSGKGPDLGGGPIRLSCRSQCAINWHQNDLWDPDMTPGTNDFLYIRKAVDDNRLRLVFDTKGSDIPTLESVDVPLVSDGAIEVDFEHQKRVKLARLLKEQRLRIRTLESYRETEANSSEREQRIIVHAYKNEIQALKQTNEQLRVQNERLQEKLSSRNEQFINLQDKVSDQAKLVEGLEDKLKNANAEDRVQIERQKLEAELVLLREQLDRRDLDLAYRDEREEQLRAELEEVKEAQIDAGKDGNILEKLRDLEVVYTAYHSGVGHVTMTSNEIKSYVQNPIAFVSAKCFVTEEQYRAWLDHHDSPVCRHKSSNGSFCLAAVDKVATPGEFELGVADRCILHKPEGFD